MFQKGNNITYNKPFYYLNDTLKAYNFTSDEIKNIKNNIPSNFFTISQSNSQYSTQVQGNKNTNIDFQKGVLGIKVEQKGKLKYLSAYQVNVTYQYSKNIQIDNVLVNFIITDYSNIISQSQKLITLLKKQYTLLLIGVCILSTIIFLIIFRNVWTISRSITVPIIKLIEILKKLSLQHEIQNLYNNKDDLIEKLIQEKESFLYAIECKLLFEAFESLIQTLKFVSAYSIEGNECNQLFHWNRAAKFFQSCMSHRAIGICQSNIGKIHYQQKRYLESAQAYKSSIIEIDYELGAYEEQNEKDLDFILLDLKFKRIFCYSRSLQKILKNQKEYSLWQEFKNVMFNLMELAEKIGYQVNQRKLIIFINMATLLIDQNIQDKANKYMNLALIAEKYVQFDYDILINQIRQEESRISLFQKKRQSTKKVLTTIDKTNFSKRFRVSINQSIDFLSGSKNQQAIQSSLSNNLLLEQNSQNNSFQTILYRQSDLSYMNDKSPQIFNSRLYENKSPFINEPLEQIKKKDKISFFFNDGEEEKNNMQKPEIIQQQKSSMKYESLMNPITPIKLETSKGDQEITFENDSIITNECGLRQDYNNNDVDNYLQSHKPSQTQQINMFYELSYIYHLWLKEKLDKQFKEQFPLSKIEQLHLDQLFSDNIYIKEKFEYFPYTKTTHYQRSNLFSYSTQKQSFNYLGDLDVKRITTNTKSHSIYQNNKADLFKISTTKLEQNISTILTSLMNLIRAKIEYKKKNIKEAAQLLTNIFEQNQVFSTDINNKALNFLSQIFQSSNQFSKQIQSIKNSFRCFKFHISFIIDCNLIKNKFIMSKIISSVALKILIGKQDTMSIHLNDIFSTTLCRNLQLQKNKYLSINLLKDLFISLQSLSYSEQIQQNTDFIQQSTTQLNMEQDFEKNNFNKTFNQSTQFKYLIQKSLLQLYSCSNHQYKQKIKHEFHSNLTKGKKFILIISDNQLPKLQNFDSLKLKSYASKLDISILHLDLSSISNPSKNKIEKSCFENDFYLSPTKQNSQNKALYETSFIKDTFTDKKSIFLYLKNQRQEIQKFEPISLKESL